MRTIRRCTRSALLLSLSGSLAVAVPTLAQEQRPEEPNVAADGAPEASTLEGRVVMPASGEGVPGAAVYFLVNGVHALTDEDGRFSAEGLVPGPEVVQVSFLDRYAQPDTILLPEGVRLRAELDAPVVDVVEVEELVVRVRRNRTIRERQREQFEREAEALAHRHLDRERLSRIDPPVLSWTLSYLELSVDSYDGGFMLPTRGPTTIYGRGGESRSTFSRQTGGLRCAPALYVNGAHWPVPDLQLIDAIDPHEVVGMAVFRGPFVPARYRSWAEGCGALVIWTR